MTSKTFRNVMRRFIKNVYRALPLKQEAFTLLKKVWSPPETIYRHLHFRGTIKVPVTKEQSFQMHHYGHPVENDLFWSGLYGNWEQHSMKLWARLSKHSSVIFDIGANTGVYTMVSKTVNPAASLHAFEPFGAVFDKFLLNAQLNKFNVTANNLAVSNYTGDAVIYTEFEDFAYSVTVNQNLWVKDKEAFKMEIKTITLRDYIESNKLTNIDLMKIDVETHEPEVMEGFGEYLIGFKPIMLIEILNEDIAEKLNSYFSPNSYRFYNIDEKNGMKKVSRLTKSDFYNFLIVPNEKAEWYDSIMKS